MVVEKEFLIDEVIDDSGLKVSSVFAKFYFDIENRILPLVFELNELRKEVMIYWIAYHYPEKVVEATRLINSIELINCPFVLQKLCLPPFEEEEL